jgi:hypothetical protein
VCVFGTILLSLVGCLSRSWSAFNALSGSAAGTLISTATFAASDVKVLFFIIVDILFQITLSWLPLPIKLSSSGYSTTSLVIPVHVRQERQNNSSYAHHENNDLRAVGSFPLELFLLFLPRI